jgi:hypothetical protein
LSSILSVFNQKRLKPEDRQWMLYFEDEDQISDPDTRAIVKRLAAAAGTEEMWEKVRVEETFDNAMENAIRKHELTAELALAEAARLTQEISEEKAAREAAEARAKVLEAQLAELLKNKKEE